MPHSIDIEAAFVQLFDGSEMVALFPGGLHSGFADSNSDDPENPTLSFPYILMDVLTNVVVERTRTGSTGGSKIKNGQLQLRVYHNDKYAAGVAARNLIAWLDDRDLPLLEDAAGSVLQMRADDDGVPEREEERLWRVRFTVQILSIESRVR